MFWTFFVITLYILKLNILEKGQGERKRERDIYRERYILNKAIHDPGQKVERKHVSV